MRDPAINTSVEAAIAEAVEIFAFYQRVGWLDATAIDWSDVDKRAEAHLQIMRLPDHMMPADLRKLICSRLVEHKLLPRGPGRHAKGEFIPRDVVIVRVIRQLERRGFKPTRNPEQKTKVASASSIACAALAKIGVHLDEGTINGIWKCRNRRRTVSTNSAN